MRRMDNIKNTSMYDIRPRLQRINLWFLPKRSESNELNEAKKKKKTCFKQPNKIKKINEDNANKKVVH